MSDEVFYQPVGQFRKFSPGLYPFSRVSFKSLQTDKMGLGLISYGYKVYGS